MPTARPHLSVVVPCFNEEAGLDLLHARLTRVCSDLGVGYELVLVNDGSHDLSWPKMTALAAADPRVVCVNLSRNHGQQIALTAGLSESRGEYVLAIDADLQDPPEVLPEMLDLLRRENADVVYGRRASRDGETRFKLATSFVFYRFLNWISDVPVPADTGDFRLMSRRVVERFLAMPERTRFVRGMLTWVGFKQVPIRYERHARATGTTKYTARKLYRLAWDALTAFSVRPLKVASAVGVACGLAAVAAWALAGWWWLDRGAVPTAGLLAGLLLLLSSGQFLALGIIGEYLGRMYTEAKGRPLFTIEQVVRGREVLAAWPPDQQAA